VVRYASQGGYEMATPLCKQTLKGYALCDVENGMKTMDESDFSVSREITKCEKVEIIDCDIVVKWFCSVNTETITSSLECYNLFDIDIVLFQVCSKQTFSLAVITKTK
ncbi:hypothetical protein LOAG_06455, partial [Loa loa]